MTSIPEDLKYTKDHEWIRIEDDFMGTCGLTDYAQEQLTDILFVELPDENTSVVQGEQVAMVESSKAASDVHSPVSGRILKVNTALEDTPELINNDPYGDGWIFNIEITERTEVDNLMNADEYEDYIE